jgi:hypothetical protein
LRRLESLFLSLSTSTLMSQDVRMLCCQQSPFDSWRTGIGSEAIFLLNICLHKSKKDRKSLITVKNVTCTLIKTKEYCYT